VCKTNRFIERSRKKHGGVYDYSLTEYIKSNIKVSIICHRHGVFQQTPNSHLNGSGCRECGYIKNGYNGRNTLSDFIKRSNNKHNSKYNYSLVEYETNKVKVDIICPEHGVFKQRPDDHLRGLGCLRCSGKYKHTPEEFIEKAIIKHGDEYDYSFTKYIKSYDKVIIMCPEHGEFEQTPNDHLKGSGCYKCKPNYPLSQTDFITKAREVHKDRYDYSKSVYVGAVRKLTIICKEHGEFKQTPNKHITLSQGCPRCIKSKGINKICNILEDNNIVFEIERKIPGCVSSKNRPYFFDIYIESFDIYIEYDGVQHFKPVSIFGGVSEFERTKMNDQFKNDFCLNNNISLFRISYKEDVYEKMNDIISKYI
jgi:hypothetical protein